MKPFDYDIPLTGLNYLEYYSTHNVYHPGVDLGKGSGQDDCGLAIKAILNGTVEYIYPQASGSGGFGIFVIVKNNGTYTRYAHLQDTSLEVGDDIDKGQEIGHIGNTGTKWCHLHLELFGEAMADIQRKHWRKWRYYPSGKSKAWVAERYIDPWPFIKEDEPDDLQKGYAWLVKNELIKSSPPKDVVEIDQLGVILERFKDKFIK